MMIGWSLSPEQLRAAPSLRWIYSITAASGEGHLEILMLPVGGEMYAVMVATPAKDLPARRAAIDKIVGSVVLKR